MFIIFGSRSSKLSTQYHLSGCKCNACGTQHSLMASVHGRYFHIFFIPMFPLWKTTAAECSHCRAAYAENQFTQEMRYSLAQQKTQQPAKRPIWHSIGCLMLLPLVLLFIIGTVVAIVKSANTRDNGAPDYAQMLREDLRKTVNFPDKENDSVSYHIKEYVDYLIVKELDKDKIEYYSRTENGKLLVLVKVDQMKKVEKGGRSDFMDMVELALATLDMPEVENAYIGIHGRWNMVLTKSPTRQDLSGDFADSEILYPFYQNDLPVNNSPAVDKAGEVTEEKVVQ